MMLLNQETRCAFGGQTAKRGQKLPVKAGQVSRQRVYFFGVLGILTENAGQI
jgi:hypothetical protein